MQQAIEKKSVSAEGLSTAEGHSDSAPREAAGDPLLALLAFLTEYHGRPMSPHALRAGLPVGPDGLSPELFVRAAERAGLSARIAERPLSSIAPETLPCVLLQEGGGAVLLVDIDHEHGDACIIMPDTGKGVHDLRISELKRNCAGFVIYAKPVFEPHHRSDPTEFTDARQWFKTTLKRMWPIYAQVLAAAVLVNLFVLAVPLFIMNVYDRVIPNQAVETLWVLALGVAIIVIFDLILKTLRSYFVDTASRRADILLSSRLFAHIMNLQLRVKPGSSGSLANKLRDFEALTEFLSSAVLVTLVDLPFLFLFIGIIALIGGPVAIIPTVGIMAALFAGYLMQRPMRAITTQVSDERSDKNGLIFESVGGLDTIKATGAEGVMQRKWDRYATKFADTSRRMRLVSGLNVNIFSAITQITTVAVIVAGVYLIGEGMMSLGGLIAATIITGRAMAPLSRVAGLISRLNHTAKALDDLDEIMKLPTERPLDRRFLSRPVLQGAIDFRTVNFAYPNTQGVKALDNVSLRIKPGEKVGVIGASGSGKSTLLRLIAGLYAPDEGNVLLDGTDIRQIDPADVRRSVALVQQEVLLFTGTVMENLTFSVPDASDERVLAAAEVAGVHDFIQQFPLGYDWQVGERGQFLSGGQRQAVTVARALVKDAPILLLDEPTAMMDMTSESRVRDRLSRFAADKTIVVVSHRRSLLEMVDRVIVMDRGKIIGDGKREAVLGRSTPKISTRLKPGKSRKSAAKDDKDATGSGGAKAGKTATASEDGNKAAAKPKSTRKRSE